MGLELTAYRARNYKPFSNTGWIEIRPITLAFGHNSSGKSALLAVLPMLRQSIEDPNFASPFVFAADNGVDLGDFEEVVLGHEISLEKPIKFGLELTFRSDSIEQREYLVRKFLRSLENIGIQASGASPSVEVEISANYNKKQRQIAITEFSLKSHNRQIYRIFRKTTAETQPWHFEPEILESNDVRVNWQHFMPRLFSMKDRTIKELQAYSDLSMAVSQGVSENLRRLAHIGPLREFPRRDYRLTGESPRDVGKVGENWLNILLRAKARERLIDTVNEWLGRLGYSLRIDWGKHGQVHPMLKDKRGLELSLKDIGFGISQILPVLIQGFSSAPGSILILEQPEIHLHPRAQAELGDMLIAIARRGVKILVETHSEHLLLRLQRRIAEGKLSPQSIKSESLAIYFIEQQSDQSRVHPVFVNDRGEFKDPPEQLNSFFSDDYIETVKWSKAIADMEKMQS